jgi:hypothetical protein
MVLKRKKIIIPKDDKSKHQKKAEATLAARLARRAPSETAEMCVVPQDETCCQGWTCIHAYPTSLIMKLRAYCNRLSFGDRRLFCSQRIQFSGYSVASEDIKKGQHLQKYNLERPANLYAVLALVDPRQVSDYTKIPAPNVQHVMEVCQAHSFRMAARPV